MATIRQIAKKAAEFDVSEGGTFYLQSQAVDAAGEAYRTCQGRIDWPSYAQGERAWDVFREAYLQVAL